MSLFEDLEIFNNLTIDICQPEDFFEPVYANFWINLSMILVYLLGLVVCSGLFLVSIFERSGLAGPFRTLVNQIYVFSVDQMFLHYLLSTSIDNLRILSGPLPKWICKFAFSVKIWTGINAAIFNLAMSATKFYFVNFFKSIPVMNDNLMSTIVFLTVILIDTLMLLSKTYIEERVPILEKICTGQRIEDEGLRAIPLVAYVVIFCLFANLFFGIFTLFQKRKMKKITGMSTHKSLGNTISNWLIALIYFFGGWLFLHLQK